MTQEEAINRIKDHMAAHHIGEYPHIRLKEALDMALSALRPVSREQVEKAWRGEWKMEEAQEFRCSVCGAKITYYGHPDKFCADCGSAMTDEAVEMVMERWEALRDEKG